MRAMIDLHCHVLPGVDDGPATVQEAIDLARAAQVDGITTIAATPHVDWSHPDVDASSIRAAVNRLRTDLADADVAVQVVPGAEVAAGRAAELDDSELDELTLGGAGWLLLECPIKSTLIPGFVGTARRIAHRGHRILLAHPERCPVFMRSPEALDELVAEGMLSQVTAGALSGRFGRTVRQCALELVARRSVHVVASDGHDRGRPAAIASELARTPVEPALTVWLTCDAPAALLSGRELPPRPHVEPSHRRGRLLRLVGG
jgi:protein-tyrosine phosphatase